MIIKTQHVTAFVAKLNGKKTLSPIDGSRMTGSALFAGRPARLEVAFKSTIGWLDLTLDNKAFKGALSATGLGVDIPDIMPLIQQAGKHTWRINLPAPAQGNIVFASQGGEGQLEFWNISGFNEEKK